jgi:hypothetical protein
MMSRQEGCATLQAVVQRPLRNLAFLQKARLSAVTCQSRHLEQKFNGEYKNAMLSTT